VNHTVEWVSPDRFTTNSIHINLPEAGFPVLIRSVSIWITSDRPTTISSNGLLQSDA